MRHDWELDLLLCAVGGAPTSGWPSRNQWAVSSRSCPSAHSYRTLATEHEALMQKYLHLVQVVETEKTVARQLRQQIEDGEMEIERLKAEVTAGRGPTSSPCTPRLLQGRGPGTGQGSSSQPQPCQPPNLQPGILAEWGRSCGQIWGQIPPLLPKATRQSEPPKLWVPPLLMGFSHLPLEAVDVDVVYRPAPHFCVYKLPD